MRKLVPLTVAGFIASAAVAAIIQDDFESYADTAALNLVWTRSLGTDADTYLEIGANGPTWPGEKCVRHTTVAARRDFTFPDIQIEPNGYLVWQFDYYDFVGNTADPRQYCQILARSEQGGGSLAELLSVGQYNAAANHNRNKYQLRVAFNSAINWINMNTDRSVGWHTFRVEIHRTYADFYVDGVLDTGNLALNPNATALWWYQVRIGSGLSSAGGQARYDNMLLYYVPEPSAVVLLVVGALALRRR
jgi:hypothetical protein